MSDKALTHQLAQQIILKVLLFCRRRLAHGQNFVGEVAVVVDQRLFAEAGEADDVFRRKESENTLAYLRLAARRSTLDRRIHGLIEYAASADQIKQLAV